MKRVFTLGLALLCTALMSCTNLYDIYSTGTNDSIATNVTVYGSHTCGYCSSMQTNLVASNIPYYFRDIYNGYENEMWKVLYDSGWSGSSVSLPVVKVFTNVYERPDISIVISALQ